MNEFATNDDNAIARMLSLFEEHAQIDAIVFLGSHAGRIEARALDKKGRSLRIDARHAVGARAWAILSTKAALGFSATIERGRAEEQAMDLFGSDEATRYQRALLACESAGGPASDEAPKRDRL